MKILIFTFALALCIVSMGCEMHPQPQHGASEAPEASADLQKALEPEPVNPDPPSFFPTPKPE
jgi:hypothetical protein